MKASLFCFISLISFLCNGQNWKLQKQMPLGYSISAFALGQDQRLYLGSADGNIYRYDTTGTEEQIYSDVNRSAVTLIEPWNRMKLFLFYRENQLIQLMNRFVTSPQEFLIRDMNVEFASLAAPGVDNSFWIYASNFNELRKYHDYQLIFNTPLTTIQSTDPVHLRAFQNLVVLLDAKTGFYFFDQFGNLANTLPLEGATYFQIVNNQVVTYNGQDVIMFDPFQPNTLIRMSAPNGEFKGVVKSGAQYIFISSSSISYYTYSKQ